MISKEILDQIAADLEARARERAADTVAAVKRHDPIGDIKAWWERVKNAEYLRMLQWLVLSVGLMAVSILFVPWPEAKTALFKLGLISAGGWIGYWIARGINRVRPHTEENASVRAALNRDRAIIIAACMIAAALG